MNFCWRLIKYLYISIYLTTELLLYTREAADSKQSKNAKNENNCGEKAQLSVRYAESSVLNIPGIQMWKIWNTINQCRTISPLRSTADKCRSTSLVTPSPFQIVEQQFSSIVKRFSVDFLNRN